MLRARSFASWALVLAVSTASAALCAEPVRAQSPQAEAALRQAIAQGGEEAGVARYNLAQWLWRQGRHAEAVETAREYLRAEPAGPFAKEARVVLCQARRDGKIVLPHSEARRVGMTNEAGSPVSRPQILHTVKPVYSGAARSAKVEGEVVVESVIDEEGCVQQVRLLKSAPHADLDQAAQDAVQQWVFQPARWEGEPVRVYYLLTVRFGIDHSRKGRS